MNEEGHYSVDPGAGVRNLGRPIGFQVMSGRTGISKWALARAPEGSRRISADNLRVMR
jgi:hypothetical protein